MKKDNDKDENIDTSDNNIEQVKEQKKKKEKRPQAQILENALGLKPGYIGSIEKRLFIARFIDYYSSETLDFIHKDKNIAKYKGQINEVIASIGEKFEEDTLLIQSFKSKQISSIIDQLKTKAEEFALERGFKQSLDKKVRNFSLLMAIPLIILVFTFSIIEAAWSNYALFPILCVFCTLSSYPRIRFGKKWKTFKEENKMEFYTENREDITILKSFTEEALENVRTRLLESKVPLQLIKFVLYGNDYKNIKIHDSKTTKGVTQYFLSLEYPPDVEPFPIPETLTQSISESNNAPEENFIILKSLKAQNGIIENFIPTFKEELAEEINKILNDCKFEKASKDVSVILPNYSPENAIYCNCGDYVEIKSIQECFWMKQFRFYLIEGIPCKCGEKVYAISLMEDSVEVPKELEKIFLD